MEKRTTKNIDPNLISLYKLWLTADAIKETLFVQLPVDYSAKLKKELIESGQFFSATLRLSVLYGLLYVVIDGYKELLFKNAKIDKLLENDTNVQKLRRFRNGIFHFHKDPIPDKVLDFLEIADSEQWVKNLHRAFDEFFREMLA